MQFPVPNFPAPNHDEDLVSEVAPFIGNFHKSLPHNQFGEVDPAAYRVFERTCMEIASGSPVNFEGVPRGSLSATTFLVPTPASVARFTSPLAGAAREDHGPDPRSLDMLPAPGILSASTAAEMTELFWMALLRDVPLASFPVTPQVAQAAAEVDKAYQRAIAEDLSDGRVRVGLDVPAGAGGVGIHLQTLFRGGLHDEQFGPLVSQFFLRDIPYGTQTISQDQRPYKAGRDFLTGYEDWLRAQDTGYDAYARAYSTCNFYADDPAYYAPAARKIATMRDLARFVNRDALHQAYFNAALFLDAVRAPLDEGNPYRGVRYSREGDFATLGGPDLLTLVSEVASRALKVVWRQKWLVHRRCRPEVYGGLMQMQFRGRGGQTRPYGLPSWVATTDAAQAISAANAAANPDGSTTLFLPMAFSAGSPTHPAYGAGHATVAGACVTVLKAWFDEDQSFGDMLARAQLPARRKEPGTFQGLLQPGPRTGADAYAPPTAYGGADAGKMTVGGELNKIAANVAMGRSMGGVHWRTDNTRSLRLGEAIATEILRKRTLDYAERPVSFSFRSFDRQWVHISGGKVRMPT